MITEITLHTKKNKWQATDTPNCLFMHIRVMLKKTSVFCREQQQNQQTWLQSRNHNPTLPEAGVSISNSSSFGYWLAPPSPPVILSRLLTLSSAIQNQMLTVAEHLKISPSQWWEFHSRKHYKVWKSRKQTWGGRISNQMEFEREERELLLFYSSFFTTSSFLILWTSSAKSHSEGHWSNPEKTRYCRALEEYKAHQQFAYQQ